MKYQVRFYTGTYLNRQRKANQDKAIVYVEHHFNASSSMSANYTLVIVGSNASQKSIQMADRYSDLVEEWLGIPQYGRSGVVVGGFGGRGDANIRYTKMPAMLVEPLFASTPNHAAILTSQPGRQRLAEILAKTIIEFFPEGGLVAFSVGHKYKPDKPFDRGANVFGPDLDPTDGLGHSEAEYAEDVLLQAAQILVSL